MKCCSYSLQVAREYRRHVNLGYLATSNPYSQHRALYLQDLSTRLSGRYSCRVSSVHQEDFKSTQLTIFGMAFKIDYRRGSFFSYLFRSEIINSTKIFLKMRVNKKQYVQPF